MSWTAPSANWEYAYDAAGNMTSDSLHAYAFDAENRIKTLDATAATYSYSGPMRVRKAQGSTNTVYIFSGSKVIAEYVNGSLSREYIYLGSQLLYTARYGAVDTYHHFDHLSTRIETRTDGAAERGYTPFPFGETWYESGPDVPGAQKYKFTSYERDQESGLDYAMFRYYSPRIGRFMSADLIAGSTYAPQTLNRYSYTRNDPINLTDVLGLVSGPDGPPPCEMNGTCPDPGNGPFSAQYGSCRMYLDGFCIPWWFHWGPFEDTGGGDPTDVSKTGKEQKTILNALDKLLEKLLKDADCLKFLGGESQVRAFFGEYSNLIGHGNFADDRVSARSGIGEINGQLYATVINREGSFFRDRGVAANPGMTTVIRGGGPQAQNFILLHEVAHGLRDSTGFLDDAGNLRTNTERNNRLLQENCSKTLGVAKP